MGPPPGRSDEKGGSAMKRYYLRLTRYVGTLAALTGFRLALN
jgi:hypothetical protein